MQHSQRKSVHRAVDITAQVVLVLIRLQTEPQLLTCCSEFDQLIQWNFNRKLTEMMISSKESGFIWDWSVHTNSASDGEEVAKETNFLVFFTFTVLFSCFLFYINTHNICNKNTSASSNDWHFNNSWIHKSLWLKLLGNLVCSLQRNRIH